MNAILNIAVRSIRKAGILLNKYYEYLNKLNFSKDINNIFFKKFILKIERCIIEDIHKSYPKHIVLNIKKCKIISNENIMWIINPLDGINNFMKLFPYFSISIAVYIKGFIEASVIYNPINDELFTATRGYGAKLNGYRLRINSLANINKYILAVDCKSKYKSELDYFFNLLNNIFVYNSIRCTGSNNLDLAYVASNRLDGFFSTNYQSLKISAGELILRESGGLIYNFDVDSNCKKILAGNINIIETLVSNINKYKNKLI